VIYILFQLIHEDKHNFIFLRSERQRNGLLRGCPVSVEIFEYLNHNLEHSNLY